MNKYLNIQFILFLISLFPFGHAKADIAPDPITAGKTVMNYEGVITDVRMVEEDVVVRIFEDEIITVAEFSMHNDGEKVDMDVGFPYSYPGEFIEFRAYINGHEVDTKDAKQKNVGRKRVTVYWKLWKMTFKKGESCDIRVEYKTKPYEWSHVLVDRDDYPNLPQSEYEEIRKLTREGSVTYILATGKNWKGKLDRCRVVFKLEGKSDDNIKRYSPKDGRITGGEIIWEYNDYEPSGSVNLAYYPNLAVKDIPHYLLGIVERYPDDARIAKDLGRRIFTDFGEIEIKRKIYHSFLAKWDKSIPQLMEYASGGRCRFNFKAGNQFYSTWWMAWSLFKDYEKHGILDEATDIAPVVSRMSDAIVDSLSTCGDLPKSNEHLFKNAKELLDLSNSLIDNEN